MPWEGSEFLVWQFARCLRICNIHNTLCLQQQCDIGICAVHSQWTDHSVVAWIVIIWSANCLYILDMQCGVLMVSRLEEFHCTWMLRGRGLPINPVFYISQYDEHVNMTIVLKTSNLRPQLFSCFLSYMSLDVQTAKCITEGEVWVQYYKIQTLCI